MIGTRNPLLIEGTPEWENYRIGFLKRTIGRHRGEFWLWAHVKELAALTGSVQKSGKADARSG